AGAHFIGSVRVSSESEDRKDETANIVMRNRLVEPFLNRGVLQGSALDFSHRPEQPSSLQFCRKIEQAGRQHRNDPGRERVLAPAFDRKLPGYLRRVSGRLYAEFVQELHAWPAAIQRVRPEVHEESIFVGGTRAAAQGVRALEQNNLAALAGKKNAG